jgi:TRAP-type C4-dicarboxylate transport system substrate-binding protein
METLGAAGSLIGLGECYSALDKGVVDGINFLWEGVMAFGFQQVTKYRTEANLMGRGFVIVMNLDIWNSLPPDVQALFEKYGGHQYSTTAGAAGDKAMDGRNKLSLSTIRK